MHNKFDIRWAGHYAPGNKVWGWFVDTEKAAAAQAANRYWNNRESYCFWAVVGKTISLNKHTGGVWSVEQLEKKKLANQYQQITTEQLLDMWPDFYQDMHNRYIFATLSDRI